MRALRPVFLVIGLVALSAGLLFVLQGLGWVRWPASSFMLDQREWVWRGALLAVAGLLLVLRSSIGRRR